MSDLSETCKECGKLLEESKFVNQINHKDNLACRNWAYCESAEKEEGTCLSYLMGADKITDNELTDIGVLIKGKNENGDRKLEILKNDLPAYIRLVKEKLDNRFWNEIICDSKIIFIFKLEDGSLKEYELSQENEQEIDDLCAKLNNESPDTTANVYKYISENNFYHDFMIKHYSERINRKKQ